jgi:hypothetical protein
MCELDSGSMRAAVLLETIETLQAGGASEQAQRVVALTAQLASAQAQGGAQEARLRELMVRWRPLRAIFFEGYSPF